jgi:hypothetical protein
LISRALNGQTLGWVPDRAQNSTARQINAAILVSESLTKAEFDIVADPTSGAPGTPGAANGFTSDLHPEHDR